MNTQTYLDALEHIVGLRTIGWETGATRYILLKLMSSCINTKQHTNTPECLGARLKADGNETNELTTF